jgi:hypothetical protein
MNSDVKIKGPEKAEISHAKVLITLGLLTANGSSSYWSQTEDIVCSVHCVTKFPSLILLHYSLHHHEKKKTEEHPHFMTHFTASVSKHIMLKISLNFFAMRHAWIQKGMHCQQFYMLSLCCLFTVIGNEVLFNYGQSVMHTGHSLCAVPAGSKLEQQLHWLCSCFTWTHYTFIPPVTIKASENKYTHLNKKREGERKGGQELM